MIRYLKFFLLFILMLFMIRGYTLGVHQIFEGIRKYFNKTKKDN